MITAQILIFTFLVPFFISFIIDWLFIKKSYFNKATIVGLVLSCLSGFTYLQGLPYFPPKSLNETFFYQFIIIGIVCLLTDLTKSRFIQIIFQVLGIIFCAYMSFNPLLEGLGINRAFIYSSILILLPVIYILIFKKINKEKEFIVMPFLFYLSMILSIVIFVYSSAFLSQLTGVLAFIILSKIILKLIKKDYIFNENAFYFYTYIILLLTLLSNYLLDIPNYISAVLVLSPLVISLNIFEKVKNLSKIKYVIFNFIIISIPLVFVLFKVLTKYFSEDPYYG